MLASLTARRDPDAEAPVVWPAWCYSGEAGGGGAGGGPARRCARDAAASPAPAHAPPAHAPQVKTERLSPHDSSASRSRSVTPSTSSYPGTPPERGSPHAPPPPAPHPPRNYSEIMRSLAARYNTHPNDYFHRVNGYGGEARAVPSPAQAPEADAHLNGIWTKMVAFRSPGAQNCTRASVYPSNMDMNTTKTLWSVSRTGRGGRTRRKRVVAGPEHSPLDLSAAGESAAKRARLSASPSVKSEFDGDRCSSDERSGECMCAEARARLAGWSVDDVYEFVSNIDICAEYAPSLREQRIDGAGLPLLTEEHLTGMLQMKLGPALKLKASVALASQCAQCRLESSPTQMPRVNGNSLKAEPRSSTTSPS